MSKNNMEADEIARTGPQMGYSQEAHLFFQDAPSGRQSVQARNKKGRQRSKKAKPKDSPLNAREVSINSATDDDNQSVASSTSVDTKDAKSLPIKTGKPNHHTKPSALHRLHSESCFNSDLEDHPLYNSGDLYLHDNSMAPAALELKRQLSGSHDFVDYLDLSNARFNLNDIDFRIANHIGKVNLDNNRLHKMPLKFLMLPKLRSISCASNLIKSVEIHTRLLHLAVLELPSNKLTKFPSADTLDKLPQLRNLILYNNNIADIPYRSVEKLAALGRIEEINLSYNELKTLPSQIGNLTSLTALRLASNLLHSLPETITDLHGVSDINFDIDGNRLSYPPQVSYCIYCSGFCFRQCTRFASTVAVTVVVVVESGSTRSVCRNTILQSSRAGAVIQ